MLSGSTIITPTNEYSGGLIPMYQAPGGLIPADTNSRYTAYQNANTLIGMPADQQTGPSQADIYAQQQAAYARQQAAAEAQRVAQERAKFNTGRDVMNSSLNESIRSSGIGYQRGIQDAVTGWNARQTSLDNKAINAMMAKSQGQQGIMQMVGQGIKSAGTMLGNRNAGSSSASQAIADAYGRLGQQQASRVGNQYELANQDIMTEQGLLSAEQQRQRERWDQDKVSVVNGIVNDAQSKIAALNEAAANANITDRMDIEAEKQRVRNQAQAELQQYDSELTKIAQAQSAEQRRSKAAELAQAGKASPTQFQYSTQIPGAFQNTGDFSSSMPLFTYGNNRNKYQG